MSLKSNFYPSIKSYSWIPFSKKSHKHSDYNDLTYGYFFKQKHLGFLKKSHFFYKLKRINYFLDFHKKTPSSRALAHWNYHYNFLHFRKFAKSNSFFLSRAASMNEKYRRGEWTNYNVMWKKHYHKTINTPLLNKIFHQTLVYKKSNLFVLFYPFKNELWNEVVGKGFPLLGLNSLGNSSNLDYPLFLNHLNVETHNFLLNSFFSSESLMIMNKNYLNFTKFQNLKRFYFFRAKDRAVSLFSSQNRYFPLKKKLPSNFFNKKLFLLKKDQLTLNFFINKFLKLNAFTALPVNYLKYLFRSLKRKEKKQKDKKFFFRNNFLQNIKMAERFYIINKKKLYSKTWFYPYFFKQKLKKHIYLNRFRYLTFLKNMFSSYQNILYFKNFNLNSFFRLPVEIPKYSIIWRFNKTWLKEEERKTRREAYLFQQWCGVYPTWWEFPLQKHKRFFSLLTYNYYTW